MTATVLYNYWTNFHRSYPAYFEIIPEPISEKTKLNSNYWRFTTNISPSDFEQWETKRKRRFLYYMDDIYNIKKVEAK